MTSILKKIYWVGCLSLNLALSFAFAFQFNSLVKASFENKGSRERIQELSSRNEELSLDLLENSRVDRIEVAAEELNFEKSQNTEYIRSLSTEVASRIQ